MPELEDIQGIIVRGYGSLKGAYFAVLRIEDAAATKRWLGELDVRSGAERPSEAETCFNLAFTFRGWKSWAWIKKRWTCSPVISRRDGGNRASAADPGGPGECAPERWRWGGPERPESTCC